MTDASDSFPRRARSNRSGVRGAMSAMAIPRGCLNARRTSKAKGPLFSRRLRLFHAADPAGADLRHVDDHPGGEVDAEDLIHRVGPWRLRPVRVIDGGARERVRIDELHLVLGELV